MKPLDDWMILELWEKQASAMDIKLALPDTVEREKDEAAVFQVVALGPDVTENKDSEHYQRVKVGDIVQVAGYGNIAKMKLPNGNSVIVGQARSVCFIMEEEDLVNT